MLSDAGRDIKPLLTTEPGRAGVKQAERKLGGWSALEKEGEWKPLEQEMLRLCTLGQTQEAYALRNSRQMAVAGEMEAAGNDVLKVQHGLLQSAWQDGRDAVSGNRWNSTVLFLLALAA